MITGWSDPDNEDLSPSQPLSAPGFIILLSGELHLYPKIYTLTPGQVYKMNSTIVAHGYYPNSILLPHYVANESSVLSLISQFGVLWAVVIVGSFGLITRLRPALKTTDHVAFVWMCLSMLYHIFLMPE